MPRRKNAGRFGLQFPDRAFQLKHNGQPCPYCQCMMVANTIRFPTRDHVVPRAAGGKNGGNILIVCNPCNNDKGGMTLEQFAQKMTMCADDRASILWDLIEARKSPEAVQQER